MAILHAVRVTLSALLVLFVVMLVLAALPSASVALVVTRSATGGFKSGAAVTAGIILGDLFFIGLALLGLTLLAEALGSFFFLLRVVGALYLIWLGGSLFLSAWRQATVAEQKSATAASGKTLGASFLAGWLLTLGDVKAIFFYASLFPALVDLPALGAGEIVTLVFLTVVTVGSVKLAYAWAAAFLFEGWAGFRARRSIRLLGGGVLSGTGAYLLAKS